MCVRTRQAAIVLAAPEAGSPAFCGSGFEQLPELDEFGSSSWYLLRFEQ
ncbi:MAG TPA: hypothetical protein VGO89_14770 [Streptomyces sp.]|jgi:hypothetical protein|nr:hypothetical protein [Streptomyces sp.]